MPAPVVIATSGRLSPVTLAKGWTAASTSPRSPEIANGTRAAAPKYGAVHRWRASIVV